MTKKTVKPCCSADVLLAEDPADRSAAAREKILDAAVAEFAGQGYAGARVDAIAGRAGINKRMLYTYVGNKKALWLASLERVYEAKRREERTLNLHRVAPAEALQLLIRFNFRYHTAHPEFLALLNDENLQQGLNLQESRRVADLYSPLVSCLAEILARGQEEGVFRRHIDPTQLYISMVGLGYFFCSNRYTLSAVFGRDLGSTEETLMREQHIVDLVLGYLRP
ncbi:MAG: TetR family transcriptional regulator [Telmatospirillum sp.]|nr:TetR family transcriptional regulator [Telmatospirillum sp.]